MMIDMTARIALAPLLGYQAVRTRRMALKMPEPEGPRAGHAGRGEPLSMLIYGDSSAAGVGVEAQSKGLSGQLVRHLAEDRKVYWALQATSGHTTMLSWADLEARPSERFDIAVQALGVNDMNGGLPVQAFIFRQRRLHRMIRKKFGTRLIFVSGMPPVHCFPLLPQPLRWVMGRQARRYDRALIAYAARTPGIVHVPFDLPEDPSLAAEDGFHPGPIVYRDWARLIARSVQEHMREDALA